MEWSGIEKNERLFRVLDTSPQQEFSKHGWDMRGLGESIGLLRVLIGHDPSLAKRMPWRAITR